MKNLLCGIIMALVLLGSFGVSKAAAADNLNVTATSQTEIDYNGTIEGTNVFAVLVQVLDDAGNVILVESEPVTNNAFSGEISGLTTGASYTLRAANYDGGSWVTKRFVMNYSAPTEAPTATPEPPTATPEPPTATPEPPTATPEPPTATPEPPTATPEPPTATPEPPTATPEPPTATPEPPTATPTATPEPPTATPKPPVTEDGKTTVQPEATVTDGTAEVSFDSKQLDSLLEELMNSDADTEDTKVPDEAGEEGQDKEKKPTGTLEIAPKVEAGIGSVAVSLGGEALKKLGSETDIDVRIKTENGGMQLPNETVGVLNEQAEGEDLKVEISKVEKEKQKEELANLLASQAMLGAMVDELNRRAQEDMDSSDPTVVKTETINPVGALKIEISAGTQSLTRFGNAMLTVSIPIESNKLLPKHPLVLAIDLSGKVYYMKGTRKGSNVAVGTNHLTTFIVTDLDYEEHSDALKNISFHEPKTVIATGSKVDFEIEVSGYELDDLTWYTARRNRATVGKNKGKLVATVTGKTAGEDTLIIKSKGKVVAELQITVEDVSASFDNPIKTMKVGEKLSFELNVTGFDKKDILWYTKRKNRVTVGKNAGKTTATVTAKTVGTDTLYVVVDGKTIAETMIKVVEK